MGYNTPRMTTEQIQAQLRRAGKPVCRFTLYRYLRRFRIRPVGPRQCPQRYPADSAERIIRGLGLKGRT